MLARLFSRPTINELVAASERHNAFNITHNIQKEVIRGDDVSKEEVLLSSVVETRKLKQNVFGYIDLVFYGLCATVGSGIYVLAGTAAKNYSGPSYVLSLLLSGLLATPYLIAIAEFASRVPVIGCPFTYVYLTSGELIAFYIAFFDVITSTITSSIGSLGIVSYFQSLLLNIDKHYEYILLGYKINDYIHINFAAPILLIIFASIVITNISLSKRFINGVTIFNMILIVMFIISGLFFINTDYLIHPCNYTQYGDKCPSNAKNSFFPFGVEGMLVAAGLSMYAFAGSEDNAKLAAETKDSKKNIPRSIYTVIFIVFILYCCVAVVLLAMVPFQSLDSNAALAKAFGEHNQKLLQQLCAIGALTTMMISLFSTLISGPRYWLRVAIDGFIPPFLKYIHPKYKTPFTSTLIYTFCAILFAAFFDLSSLFKFLSSWAVIMICAVYNGIMILRYSKPNNTILDYSKYNKRVIIVVWLYTFCCWIVCFVIVYRNYFNAILWYIIVYLLCFVAMICVICLIYFDIFSPWKSEWMNEKQRNETILMPLVPYLPCLCIAITSYMLALYGILLILEILIMFVIGFIFYALYSYHHIVLHQIRNSN